MNKEINKKIGDLNKNINKNQLICNQGCIRA
jgi:hypothetical protein